MREFIKYDDSSDAQPDFSRRPQRNTPFTDDDILNLKISLEISQDIQDLISDPHLFQS
jgi:hypothetical protein